jgi:hypothetical protein
MTLSIKQLFVTFSIMIPSITALYHYAECCYAECHLLFIVVNAIMQSVIILKVIMLSVIMLSVIMLSVIMLSVVMLSVVLPYTNIDRKNFSDHNKHASLLNDGITPKKVL